MRSQIPEELPICPQHVPGDDVAGQELEQFADPKGPTVHFSNQNGRPIQKISVDRGMLLGSRKTRLSDYRFLILKMLGNVADQSIRLLR